MYNNKDKYCCKKHCHHEEQSKHCCNESHLRKKCCKCRGYCNMIHFKKYNGCCKFIYKCQCGYCFEIICDYENNCFYERECSCLDEKKDCHSNCLKKCCKCR